MQQEIKLRLAKLPTLLGRLTESNQFLKFFCALSGASTLGLIFVLAVVAMRPPIVLSISAASAEEMKIAENLPSPEQEVRAAIGQYLDRRYKWTPADVKTRLDSAGAFILPANFKAYQAAMEHVRKFAVEKLVAQRVYPGKIEVSLEKKIARISGDRLTEIQNLKAAGNLRLELSFESGPRTKENPWGIYITKEREEM